MLRQSSSRSHRSKKLRPSHGLQVFLFVAVGIWIVYQLTHSYGKRRAVAVETDGSGGEPARRRLGRKGSVDFAAGQASVDDDIVGDGDGDADGSDLGQGADSSDDPLSKAGDGDGDEDDDQEAGEDDGVDSDADDGLAADEEEDDDRDLQSQDGSSEDELKTAHGETRNGLNTSIAPPVNATDTLQGGVAVLLANATGRAADGTAPTLNGSALKNTSSVDQSSLHARGTAGDIGNKLLANSGSPGENQNLQIDKNGTAADSVAGHGISS